MYECGVIAGRKSIVGLDGDIADGEDPAVCGDESDAVVRCGYLDILEGSAILVWSGGELGQFGEYAAALSGGVVGGYGDILSQLGAPV